MCWYNWLFWRWAQGCSKHVGNLNKYIYIKGIVRKFGYLLEKGEMPLCNYCFSANDILITYVCLYLGHSACNGHARNCHLWPVRLCSIFPRYVINGTIFEESYWTWNVFWFSLQLSSETFSHSTKNWARYDKSWIVAFM
jgi:hypothetical protein